MPTKPVKTHGNKHGSRWITKERRLAIYIRDGFACAYCGKDLRHLSARNTTLDHLIPRCDGGNNKNENLITACLTCNSGRRDKSYAEYATAGALIRIDKLRLEPINLPLAKAIIAGTAGDPRVEAQR